MYSEKDLLSIKDKFPNLYRQIVDSMKPKPRKRFRSEKHIIKKWQEDNPEKTRAHYLFRKEIKKGNINRQPCEICNIPEANGHHDDYTKPLEVRWLCFSHHRKFHCSHVYDKNTFTYIHK